MFVDGLSEWVVRSPGEVYHLMQRGQSMVRERGKRGGSLICCSYILLAALSSFPIAPHLPSVQPEPQS